MGSYPDVQQRSPSPRILNRLRFTDYNRCVEDHHRIFIQAMKNALSGLWILPAYLQEAIYRYLDCGNLHNGFARVRCGDYNHEYLLAFSCKRRHFCPPIRSGCGIREWLCARVLKKGQRHFVFLRRYFLYDRRLCMT